MARVAAGVDCFEGRHHAPHNRTREKHWYDLAGVEDNGNRGL